MVHHQSKAGISRFESKAPGPWFNIKMPSYQFRKSHCGDKTVVRSSYLHNGISYTGKTTSLYWTSAQSSQCPVHILQTDKLTQKWVLLIQKQILQNFQFWRCTQKTVFIHLWNGSSRLTWKLLHGNWAVGKLAADKWCLAHLLSRKLLYNK